MTEHPSRREFLFSAAALSAVLIASGCRETKGKETGGKLPNKETLLVPPPRTMLAKQEQKAWTNHFDKEISVPLPPQELVTALFAAKEKGITSLVPYYMPQVTNYEQHFIKAVPQPDGNGYSTNDKDKITYHVTTGGYWMLIDTSSGDEDIQGDLLTMLDENRSNVSHDEITTHIFPRIARSLHINSSNISLRLPTMFEETLLSERGIQIALLNTDEEMHEAVSFGVQEKKYQDLLSEPKYGAGIMLEHLSDFPKEYYPDFIKPLNPSFKDKTVGFRTVIVFKQK